MHAAVSVVAFESSAVGEVRAAVAARLADVPLAKSNQPGVTLPLLVLALLVVAQLRLVLEAGVAHAALVDRDGDRLPLQVTNVLALLQSHLDHLQQPLLRDALFAACLSLERVTVSCGPVADHLGDALGWG